MCQNDRVLPVFCGAVLPSGPVQGLALRQQGGADCGGQRAVPRLQVAPQRGFQQVGSQFDGLRQIPGVCGFRGHFKQGDPVEGIVGKSSYQPAHQGEGGVPGAGGIEDHGQVIGQLDVVRVLLRCGPQVLFGPGEVIPVAGAQELPPV